MILDCTFRDGGYHTNWNFDNDLVREVVSTLDVDYIELGYKSNIKGGSFKECDDRFISKLLQDVNYNCKLAFMIDIKDFSDKKSLLEVIQEKNKSPFTLCRIATDYNNLDFALEMSEVISDLGYETALNLMKVSTLSNLEVGLAVQKINKSNVDMIYIVDSLGSIKEKKLISLIEQFKTDKILGFHSHDNLGLAFSNTIKAVELGVDIIDGTICGMGRAAGNLKLEQYLMYVDKSTNKLLNLIENRFSLLKQKYNWGWNTNHMYSGINEIHPTHTSISIIIPARYKSNRFPGKPIVDIDGIPMVIRVADIASQVVPKQNIYIATDDERISDIVEKYGYNYIMTTKCLTGTDRVAQASRLIDGDIILNIQGDEPLLNPNDIRKVIDCKLKYMDSVINCMSRFDSTEATNRNIPKVVSNFKNELVYMSRSAIPGTKYGHSKKTYKQVCIYAFTKDELNKFYEYGLENGKSQLEWTEDIEILRFVELGMKVKMVETFGTTQAVDVPNDVNKVLEIINDTDIS